MVEAVVLGVPYTYTYLLAPYLLEEPVNQDDSLNQRELWDWSP